VQRVEQDHRVDAAGQRDGDPGADAGPITFGDVVADARERTVTVSGAPVELTAKEFDLLLFLARHLGQVFTRDELMESVCEIATPPCRDTREAGTQLRALRRRVQQVASETGLAIGAAGTTISASTDSHSSRPISRSPPASAPRSMSPSGERAANSRSTSRPAGLVSVPLTSVTATTRAPASAR